MKKKNIIYTLVIIFFAAYGCKKDYDLKEIDAPRGAMVTTEFNEVSNYIERGATNVANSFSITSQPDAKSATITLQVDSVVPEIFSDAITVYNQSITVSGRNVVKIENFATIDWSVLNPTDKGIAYISVVEKVDGAISNYGSKATINFSKGDVPTLYMDEDATHKALLNQNASKDSVITVVIDVLEEAALEDLAIPFRVDPNNLTEGVHFDVANEDRVLNISAGSTTANIKVKVYEAAFGANEYGEFWPWITSDDLPDGVLLKVSDNDWTTIKIGRNTDGTWVSLFEDNEYNAQVPDNATGIQTITLELENFLNKPAPENMAIPIGINTNGYTNGNKFSIDNLNVTVEQGATTGKIDITINADKWSAGEFDKIWLEVHSEYMPEGFDVNPNNWWTTVWIGRVFKIVTLDQSMNYDATVANSQTGDHTITLTFENMLEEPAETALQVPVNINNYYGIPASQMTLPNGYISIAQGSTNGTFDVINHADGWAADENQKFWIELDPANMPAGYKANDSGWWTAVAVGKSSK